MTPIASNDSAAMTRPEPVTIQKAAYLLDAPVAGFDLEGEVEVLRSQPAWRAHGHSAKTLIKHPDLRIVLVVLAAGARLQQHKTEHRLAVQALRGRIRLSLPGQDVTLSAGQLLVLDKAIPHDVVAHEDSAFILTLTWSSPVQQMSGLDLDVLSAEHARFHRLLDLLEAQIGRFHCDAQPDYDLMHDIFFYLTHYPDRLHHAIEDRAYARLAERVPGAGSDVAELARQHRLIADTGARFLQNLDAALGGAICSRDAIEGPAQQYIALYRDHIRLEESRLLPLGRVHLRPEDWAEILATTPVEEDPLFGPLTEARFAALHRQIASIAECGCDRATAR